MADLHPFEGTDVVSSTIIITNAGDGLSENLKVEPIEIHRGNRGYLVLEWECTKVGFMPANKDDLGGDAIRVQTLRAGTAVFCDAELVADLIAHQKDKNLLAKEDAAGIQRFPEVPGCPFPGCPLEEDHDGDHENSPASGLPQPDQNPSAVPDVLTELSKTQLRDLCDRHELVYVKAATGPQLCQLLSLVPGITDEAQALLDELATVTDLHPEEPTT